MINARYKQTRFFFRVTQELARKHTLALLGGFLLGIIGSIVSVRVGPVVYRHFFTPIDRIAIIGEFTPTTLPITIQKQLSIGMTHIEPDGSVTPELASSWEATESGTSMVYTLRLRQDVSWHDGKPLIAKDINYNIKNVTLAPIDAYTIQAKLSQPYSPFPTLLARPLLRPGLIGLGDYKVESIILNGGTIRVLRLASVHSSRKKAIEYRFYRTESQAIIAYKLGEIDRIDEIENVSELSRWDNTTIKETVHYDRIVALFFNVKTPLFAEKNTRQALGYATTIEGQERAYSPISRASWAYTDNVKKYTDISSTQIKKLLANSPLASTSAELTISTFTLYVPFVEKIVEQWKQYGITAKIRLENSLPHDYQVLVSALNLPPDPDVYPFWHSTQTTSNITGYTNVKVDKLLEDGRKELDIEKRKKLYIDFQKRLVEDAPAIFLYYPKTYSVKRIQ